MAVSLSACNNVVSEAPGTYIEKINGEPEGPHTSSEWKIWAYSTAAPSYIASDSKASFLNFSSSDLSAVLPPAFIEESWAVDGGLKALETLPAHLILVFMS